MDVATIRSELKRAGCATIYLDSALTPSELHNVGSSEVHIRVTQWGIIDLIESDKLGCAHIFLSDKQAYSLLIILKELYKKVK